MPRKPQPHLSSCLRHRATRGGALLLIALLGVSLAHADELTDRIRALTEAGQANTALELAEQSLGEREGDADFDFAYGLAALDAGQSSSGVFALERVLQQQPENLRARIELARGLYLLQQYEEARKEFQQVLDADPPGNVRDNIDRYLTQIHAQMGRYRTHTRAWMEVGVGHDSNLNAGLDDLIIDLPGGALLVSEASQASEDSYLQSRVGAEISHPLRPGLRLLADASLLHQANQDLNDLDRTLFDGRVGLAFQQDTNDLRLSLQGQKFLVDGEGYRRLWGLTGEWRRQYGGRTQTNLFVQGMDLAYDENPLRDARQFLVGIAASRSLGGNMQPVVFASAYGGREFAELDSADAEILTDREFYGLRGGVQLIPSEHTTLDLSLHWRRSEYLKTDPGPFFVGDREDDWLRLVAGLNWRLGSDWLVRGELAWQQNDSSNPIHEYDGSRVDLTLRKEF